MRNSIVKKSLNFHPVISYININSLRYKFDLLSELLKTKNMFSILIIAETKLDKSFPNSQFILDNFKCPYRLDKSKVSGGLLVYVLTDIVSRQLSDFLLPEDFQAIPFEINLKNGKWLIIAVYNPLKQNGGVFLEKLSTLLDYYLRKYDNFIIIGDMNLEPHEPLMKEFMENYCLFNLIKKPTCFKTQKGTCLDLILTNKKSCFQYSDTFETGLSDCHTLVHTMFKSTFYKLPPKKIVYRDYKRFNEKQFIEEVSYNLKLSLNSKDFVHFNKIISTVLNEHAPLKEKMIRGNDKPFITKEIRKEIWNRSRLKNKANKSGLPSDYINFKKQRNFVTSLVRQKKRNFFNEIEITDDKKKFWKACKPYLSKNFIPVNDRICLKNNDSFITDEKEIAGYFNYYFANITSNLNLDPWKPDGLSYTNINNHSISPDFCTHPSILKINEKYNDKIFNFEPVKPDTVFEVISSLKKGSGTVPLSIVKLLSKPFCENICDSINSCINNCLFPDELKWADIIPIFKKGDHTDCKNYRPISILPTFSKVFEKIIFDQINSFFQDKFSNFLCGFRKGFSTQTALIKLLQKWQHSLDQKGIIGTVLIDLSKAYDCIRHDLLLAKLEAYGFSNKSILLLLSYLKGRKQRVKLFSTFSTWLEVNFGIPQGSILGPLLFNIFINDIFLFLQETEICNFADDNTLFACDISIENVLYRLNNDLGIINHWFKNNSLVANPSKFQLMFLGVKNVDNISINILDNVISSQTEVELLGVTIDHKLTFSSHIKKICNNASNKLCAILRLRKSMSISQAKLLVNAHVLSNFFYCPLIWMFCRKGDMSRINRIHKRALRTIYNNFDFSLDELLELDNSCTIHQKHLQFLMIEVFNSINHNNPELMWDLFCSKDQPYHLRNQNLLKLPTAKTTKYGTNSLIFRGSLIWNSLPNTLKLSNTLSIFKNNIKSWKCTTCTCIYCK